MGMMLNVIVNCLTIVTSTVTSCGLTVVTLTRTYYDFAGVPVLVSIDAHGRYDQHFVACQTGQQTVHAGDSLDGSHQFGYCQQAAASAVSYHHS
jgi:hypothetical protein